MAYIGAEPVPGQNREVDDISSGFNGNATAFTLQVSSVNVSPESANNILINLGGVLQNPGTDYTIAASTITFTTAPAAGLSFFGLILGAGINTATVADGTIGTSKVVDNSITADKLAHTSVTAGSYTTADITVDAQGRVTAAANGTIATAEIADGAVNNAKVNASAAIAASKIADFVTGNTNNRVLTATGTANSLNGEANLTFDGNNLLLNSASGNVLFGETTAYNTFENGSTNPKLQVRGTNLNGSCQAWIRATADAGAPKLFIANTRNTSSNGHTIVQSGDELGGLFFAGSDGSQFVNGASIAATVTGTPGADDVPGALVFGTNAGAAATTERMRIDKDGNVGIGTTSPASLLHIADATEPAIRLQDTNAANSDFKIYSPNGDNSLRIYHENTSSDLFHISSGGNVGIGTTSPSRKLHVASSFIRVDDGFGLDTSGSTEKVVLDNGFIAFTSNSNERMRIDSNGKILIGTSTVQNSSMLTVKGTGVTCISTEANLTSAFTHLIFVNPNGNVGDIRTSGSSTVYNTSSDYRLKENIVSISDGITRLKTLKPSRFNFKADASITVDGFLAHEVTAVPEAISGTKDEVDADNKPVYQGIDQSKLVPLLTAALQEAVTKIETLETKVAALEAA